MKAAVGCLVGFVVILVLVLLGAFVVYAGALTMNAQEPDAAIPPEIEAAYHQVGARTGVHWAILAAWDAAENRFALPIPSVDQLYAAEVRRRLAAKRRAAENWCREHPDDTDRCPPEEPELTPAELQAAWRTAHERWRQRCSGTSPGGPISSAR